MRNSSEPRTSLHFPASLAGGMFHQKQAAAAFPCREAGPPQARAAPFESVGSLTTDAKRACQGRANRSDQPHAAQKMSAPARVPRGPCQMRPAPAELAQARRPCAAARAPIQQAAQTDRSLGGGVAASSPARRHGGGGSRARAVAPQQRSPRGYAPVAAAKAAHGPGAGWCVAAAAASPPQWSCPCLMYCCRRCRRSVGDRLSDGRALAPVRPVRPAGGRRSSVRPVRPYRQQQDVTREQTRERSVSITRRARAARAPLAR